VFNAIKPSLFGFASANCHGKYATPSVMSLFMLSLAAPLAEAETVNITAQFRPGNTGNGFENTTPVSGYCSEFGGCASGETSVALPVEYERRVFSGLPPLASRWSLQAPPQARVTLFSEQGAALALEFQVTHLAQLLTGTRFSRYENPAFHWSAGGGCNFVNSQPFDGSDTMGFVWQVTNPSAPGLCYPTSGGVSEGEREIAPRVKAFSVGYRLVMPPAHSVPMGRYTGSLVWSVGEVGDIALGAQVSGLSSNSVTFDFEVNVEHDLSVDMEGSATHVVLQPRGATWIDWMIGGVPATAQLAGHLPLRITTTGPFAVYLTCEHTQQAGDCAINNTRTGEAAGLATLITLPPTLVHQGSPIQRMRLIEHVHYDLEPRRAIVAEPGEVEFHTLNGEVQQMIKRGGDTYSGQVTLHFDAQLL